VLTARRVDEVEALLQGEKRSAAVLPSILAAIGQTPLVRLHLPGVSESVELWGKCEWLNPGGSVKDRTALSLLTEGWRHGALRPGLTIIDSSSGNTAVGLALVGRALGHEVELVMPSSVSAARRRLCIAYGARIVETAAADGSDGALVEVRQRVAANPERYFYADQYRSPANPLAHYRTTGPEIWEQTEGRLTHFVAGLGTSGTLMGVSRFLRERGAQVRIAAVQPDLPFHGIEGLKHMPSALVPEIYDPAAHDTELAVSTEEAHETCAQVLESDGLLLGHSAGAALAGARRLALGLTRATIVAILPDGGDRYLEEQEPA
jgi:S-sulfo-L-cysteine synthase (O-acetyl-L-serine-dependent)